MKTNVKVNGNIIKSTLVIVVLFISVTSFGQFNKSMYSNKDLCPVGVEEYSTREINEISSVIAYSVNKEFHLKFNKPSDERVSIYIYDISGKQVHTDYANSGSSNIEKTYNFNDFSSGIYIVNLHSSSKVVSRKLFI